MHATTCDLRPGSIPDGQLIEYDDISELLLVSGTELVWLLKCQYINAVMYPAKAKYMNYTLRAGAIEEGQTKREFSTLMLNLYKIGC